ncbi:MAG: hypothetical protein ACJAT0_000530, partial [Nonlabens sp.]
NYDDLQELYGELLGVYSRYVGHVVTNVGGVYEDLKKPTQAGTIYRSVDKKTQKESIEWIQNNVFETPLWLVDKQILQNINPDGYFDVLRSVQVRHLNGLLSHNRIGRLINSETVDTDYYSALNMLQDIRKAVFTNSKVDIYKRNLQRAYVERMEYLMTEVPGRSSYDIGQSDVKALVRGEFKALLPTLRTKRNTTSSVVNRYHYEDLLARVDLVLNPR